MKILISGSGGLLASKVKASLETKHDFVTLGRHESDISWTLGEIPPSHAFEGIDAIIHFAWSTSDRINDFDLNVGGTLQFIQEAEKWKVPFLFISTVTVDSRSAYGKSKKLAENFVENHGGQILRLGLVPEANYLRLNEKRTWVRIVPNIKKTIKITELDSVIKSINSWLAGRGNAKFSESKLYISVDYSEEFTELFKQSSRLAILVPTWTVKFGFLLFGRFSRRIRNLYDAYQSIKTSEQ